MRWALVAVVLLGFVAVAAVFVACDKVSRTAQQRDQSAETSRADGSSPKAPPDRTPDVKPSGAFPPASWTHHELLACLNQKGLKLKQSTAGPLLAGSTKPAAIFHEGDAPDRNPAVMVYLCSDAAEARDQAGSMGEGSFPAGRFAIGHVPIIDRESDDAGLLKRIAAALR
jgi:hypothetical protein